MPWKSSKIAREDCFNDSSQVQNSDCLHIPLEGFSALPVGNYNNGNFNNVGSNANFWSATENNSNNANNWNMNASNANLNNNNKNNGFAIRCLQDSSTTRGSEGLIPSDLFCLLTKAYYDARRHKRNTINQLDFERNLEENLIELTNCLLDGTYKPLPSVCFINERPVKREVIAANFRDRVVHHLLYNWIYTIFDSQFIFDSYSCRIGKGTLFGIHRAAKFIRRESHNFQRECWVLRLDISGFFMSIDRDILYDLCIDGLERSNWRNVPDKRLCRSLLKTFVYLDPLQNALFRSSPEKWIGLPANKTLRCTAENRGLPIGNLTSQLFGNIYLNPLDQFIKHKLKIHSYGRYVDDMILVHQNKNVLLDSIERIRIYLRNRLRLVLHPNKVYLQPIQKGFSFLGAFIVPGKIFPGRRLVRNYRECLSHPVQPEWRQQKRIVSYEGILKHFFPC